MADNWWEKDVESAPQQSGNWWAGDVEAPTQHRSGAEEFGRQLGLTGRAGLQGAGDIADVLASPFRVGLNALGMNIQGRTGAAVADVLGLPKPETKQERYVEAGAEAMAGGAGPIALGRKLATSAAPVVSKVGESLAQSPGLQSILSALAGTSAQAVEESGGGAGSQMAAAVGVPVAAVIAAKSASGLTDRVRNILSAVLPGGGATAAAGRVATDVLGERATGAPAALRAGMEPETAAQAVAPTVGSAEFAGLERLAASRAPSEFGPLGTIERGRQQWADDAWAALNQQVGPTREAVLQAATAGQSGYRLNVAPLVQEVDTLLAAPENSNRTAQGVLNFARKELARIADPVTGELNAASLYNVRKDIGLKIERMMRDGKWDAKTGRNILGSLQKSMDWEIERASGMIGPKGGMLWREGYMDPFAARAQQLTGMEDRVEAAKKMGAAGAEQARAISKMDEVPISIPNLLSRPVMIINFLLRLFQGYGAEATGKEIARLMRPENKAELAALIEREMARRAAIEPIGQAVGRAARVGAVAGAEER